MLTRLAPSPTGALHLGNARTFLANWLLARQRGWRILLRIEDIDGPRIKPGSAQQLIDDLNWLGIDWDEGPIYQSARMPLYTEAISRLLKSGLAYPCICTRREIESAASAPHAEDGAAVYPGTCRDRFESVAEAAKFAGRPPAIRFKIPHAPPLISEAEQRTTLFHGGSGAVQWTDGFAGIERYEVAPQLGDFVIAKADGTPAYQLAVVVDDLQAGVTHIVRGDDLLDSTPRQILLYRALHESARIPEYFHLPLVVGPDGYRLAKRHGDSRLGFYRDRGVWASAILKLLARWCAIDAENDILSAESLIGRFDLQKMSPDKVVYTRQDEARLLNSI